MQQAISNAYEKEIETLLTQANSTIGKQKDALVKANENSGLKERVKELEKMHVDERQTSQKAFQDYQGALRQKESKLEKEHQEKC